jgi:DNA mismatch endonuclease (patch repair protein)
MSATSAEKLLRATLWEFGVRFRANERVLNSTPSFVIASCKIAVFVDGCEESHCPWHGPKRKSTAALWKRLNDRDAKLRKEGWAVVRIWQHEIENTPRMAAGRIAMVVRTVKEMTERAKKK